MEYFSLLSKSWKVFNMQEGLHSTTLHIETWTLYTWPTTQNDNMTKFKQYPDDIVSRFLILKIGYFWIKILYHNHIMWPMQQAPLPDDSSCQPCVLLLLATLFYCSLKGSLHFHFALNTTGHTASLSTDYWPPWSTEISVWIHVTQWIWYNGDLEISQNSSFCVVLFIPQGQGDIKYSLPLNAFVDLTLDLLMAILLFENENT